MISILYVYLALTGKSYLWLFIIFIYRNYRALVKRPFLPDRLFICRASSCLYLDTGCVSLVKIHDQRGNLFHQTLIEGFRRPPSDLFPPLLQTSMKRLVRGKVNVPLRLLVTTPRSITACAFSRLFFFICLSAPPNVYITVVYFVRRLVITVYFLNAFSFLSR